MVKGEFLFAGIHLIEAQRSAPAGVIASEAKQSGLLRAVQHGDCFVAMFLAMTTCAVHLKDSFGFQKLIDKHERVAYPGPL